MKSTRPSSSGKCGIVLLVIVGQSVGAPVSAPVSLLPAKPQSDASQLAHEVFENEVQAQIHDRSRWCYRQLKEELTKKKLFAVCETNDGEIDRLLEVDGQELNPKQRQDEDQRIQKMLDDPDQMRQQRKKSEEDGKLERDLLKMFPDACRFQYDGMRGNLIKLRFTPNPDFRPSTRAAQVFHHMEGSLLVDGEQKRLAEIEGQLTSPVRFGWGLLGHLDKGGTFHVKQQDLGSGHWELTMLDVQMSGKALLFKTIGVRENEIDTDFRTVPEGIRPQEAFELLRRERPLGMCAEGECSKAGSGVDPNDLADGSVRACADWQRNHVWSGRPGAVHRPSAMAMPVATNRINPHRFREGRRRAFNGLCMVLVKPSSSRDDSCPSEFGRVSASIARNLGLLFRVFGP